jgi:hypothetical protein
MDGDELKCIMASIIYAGMLGDKKESTGNFSIKPSVNEAVIHAGKIIEEVKRVAPNKGVLLPNRVNSED